jgi:hypothetical protein
MTGEDFWVRSYRALKQKLGALAEATVSALYGKRLLNCDRSRCENARKAHLFLVKKAYCKD